MNSCKAYMLLKHTHREITLSCKEFLASKAQYAKALKNAKIEEKTVYEVSDKIIKIIQAIGSQLQHHQRQTTLTSKPKPTSTKPQQTPTSPINLTPTLHQIQTIFSLPTPPTLPITCPSTLSQLLFATKVHLNLISFLVKQEIMDSQETVSMGLGSFIEATRVFVKEWNHVSGKLSDKREKEAVGKIKDEWKSIVLRITGKYFEYVFNLVQQNNRSDRQDVSMEIVARYLVLIAQLTTATILVLNQTNTQTSTSFWPFKRSIKQNSAANTSVMTAKLQKSQISISGQYSQCQSMQQTSHDKNNQNRNNQGSNLKSTQLTTYHNLLTKDQHQIIDYYKKSLMQIIFSLHQTHLSTIFRTLIHTHLRSSTTKNNLQLTIIQLLYSNISRQQLESQVSEELQVKQYKGLLKRCNLFFGVLEEELANGKNHWGDGNKVGMLEFVVEVYEKVMIEHKAFLERQFVRKVEISSKMSMQMKQKQKKRTGSNFRRFSFAQTIQDTNKATDNSNDTEYTTNTPDHTTQTPTSNVPLCPTPQPFSLQLYQTNFSVINILNLLYDPLNNPETKTPDPSINVNKLNTLLTLHQVYLNQLNLPQLKQWISKKNPATSDNYLDNLKQLQKKLMTSHQSTYLTLTTPYPPTKPSPKPTATQTQQQQQQYLLSYQTIILESLQQLTTQLNELVFVYHNTYFTLQTEIGHFQYYEHVATGILDYVRQLMLLMYKQNASKRQNDASVIKNNVMTSIKMVKLLESLIREIWLEYSRIFSQNQQHETYSTQYKQMLLQMMNSWMSTLQRFSTNQPESSQLQYRNLKSLQIISVMLSSDNKDNTTLQPTEQHQPSPTYLTPYTTPFIKKCLILCQHTYPYLSNQPHLKTKSRIVASVINPLFQLFSFHPTSQENLTLLIQVMSDNYYNMKEKLCEERYTLGEELMVIDMVVEYFEAWVNEWRGSGKRAISVQREEMLERLVIVLELYHNQATGMNHFHKQFAADAMDTLGKIDQSCKRTFKELVKLLLLGKQYNLQQDDIIREGSDTTSKQQSLRLVKIITQSPLYTTDCTPCITSTLPNNPNLPTTLTLLTKLCQLPSSPIINQQHYPQSQHDTNHHKQQQLVIQLSNIFSEVLCLSEDQGRRFKIEQLEGLLQVKELMVKEVGRKWGNFVVSWEVEMRVIQGYVRGNGNMKRVEELLGKVEGQVKELVGLYNDSSSGDVSGNNSHSINNNPNRLYYLHHLTHPLPHLINIIPLLHNNPNLTQPLHPIITTITSLYTTLTTHHLTPPQPHHTPTPSNLTIPQTPNFKLHSQQPSGLQSIIINNSNMTSGFGVGVRRQLQLQVQCQEGEDQWGMVSGDGEELQDGRQVIVSELEIGEGGNKVRGDDEEVEQWQLQQQQQIQQHQQRQQHQQPQNTPTRNPLHLTYPLPLPPPTSTFLTLTHFHTTLLTILQPISSNCQLIVATILSTLVKIFQVMIQSKNDDIEWQDEKKQIIVEVVRVGVKCLGLGDDDVSSSVLVLMGEVKQCITQMHSLYPFLQQQLPTLSPSQPQHPPLTPKQPTSHECQPPLNNPTHLQQLALSTIPSQLLTLSHSTKHSLPQQLSTLYQSLLEQPHQTPTPTPTTLQTKSLLQQIHQLFLNLLTPTPNPPQPSTIQCYHEIFSTIYPTLVDLLEFPQLSQSIKLILKQNLQLQSTSNFNNISNTMTQQKLQHYNKTK